MVPVVAEPERMTLVVVAVAVVAVVRPTAPPTAQLAVRVGFRNLSRRRSVRRRNR